MSTASLLSPAQAEHRISEVFEIEPNCMLSVSEERAFENSWLALGTINLVAENSDGLDLAYQLRKGGYEWQLPSFDESISTASRLLGLEADGDNRRVETAMGELASIAARVGLIHAPFDPTAIEQMPFRQSTTVVVDTSGVLVGALDFVARFLHPAARVKVPAITQMEIANMVDRFLRIRRENRTSRRARELVEHLKSQGGQRALLRLELHTDTEVERTYLLGDPLRSAFRKDTESDVSQLDISSPVRSYADRLILEAARHHQAQSGPAHIVRLLTGDQGLARMALSEGVRPLYFNAPPVSDVFGQRLSGQVFDPFSGGIRRVPLTALLWELATAFGSARLSSGEDRWFQVTAIGENLAWAPYHAEQDLLWCVHYSPSEVPLRTAEGDPSPELASQTEIVDRRPQTSVATRPAGRSVAYQRFSVESMFLLVCALDDNQEMTSVQVETLVGSKGPEYRRFLQSGELVDVLGDLWRAGDRIAYFSAALRNERVADIREVLFDVPSFAAFADRLTSLPVGSPLDTSDMGRRWPPYRILGEVTLICAFVSGSGIFTTPNVPDVADFADIALRRFASLDREGSGLVATGEWIESLIRDEGIHPEVTRRLLDEASETRLLRRSTEGSTTQVTFDDRFVYVLRSKFGLPVVERVYLYRGDYLIPGKASVSLRIEGPKS